MTEPTTRKGRPRKDPENYRGAWVGFRVSEAERRALDADAAAAGLTPSEYVREKVFTGRVVIVQRREMNPLDRANLGRIGSNLNQIARHLNAGREVPAAVIEAALQEWRDFTAKADEF